MTSETWKLAQRLEPELWARLASGKLNENTVDRLVSRSLDRAERFNSAATEFTKAISKIDWSPYFKFAKGGYIKPRREPQIVVDSRKWTGRY